MKGNRDKCNLLLSGESCVTMNVNGFVTENIECKNYLKYCTGRLLTEF